VELPRSLKRKAERKQREYKKVVAAGAAKVEAMAEATESDIGGEQPKKKKGFFSALLEENETEQIKELELKAEKETKKEEWFDFLASESEEKKEEKKGDKGLFGKLFSGSKDDEEERAAVNRGDTTAVTAAELVEGKKAEESPTLSVVEMPPPATEEKAKPMPKKKEERKKVEPAAEEEEGFLKKLFSAPTIGGSTPLVAPKEEKVFEKPPPAKKKEAPSKPAPVKREDIVPAVAAYVTPDPKKVFWGGEDAVFVSGRTFGVFDGVSGALKLDGVPLYSKTLAQRMKRNLGKDKKEEVGLQLGEITSYMEDAVEFCNEKATGASTAIVGSITQDGYLRVLNVGDSTCVVVRNSKIVTKTREINHFYECPYQFSEDSPDVPKDGTRLNFELLPGDVIVMGSDGIFDNLTESDIVEIIDNSPNKSPATLAKQISEKARKVSFRRDVVTPFSQLAKRNKNPDYPDGLGGKVDDIGCVVACFGEQ